MYAGCRLCGSRGTSDQCGRLHSFRAGQGSPSVGSLTLSRQAKCADSLLRLYKFSYSTLWYWIVWLADIALLLIPCIEQPAYFKNVPTWVALLIEILALSVLFISFFISMTLQDKRRLLREAVYPYIFTGVLLVTSSRSSLLVFTHPSRCTVVVIRRRHGCLLCADLARLSVHSMVTSPSCAVSLCLTIGSECRHPLVSVTPSDGILE